MFFEKMAEPYSLCDMKCSERSDYKTQCCFGKKKKPLVALILVTIIMLLSIAEAAPPSSISRNARRHNRKNEPDIPSEKLRHGHLSNHYNMQREKKSKYMYKNASRIVHRKLTNMLKHFKEGMKELNIMRNFTTGKPKWLPKVNFLSIHSITMNSTDIRKQYKFVAQKLNQNLNDYKRVFELLSKMKVHAESNYHDEHQKRQRFIKATHVNIVSTIADLTDGLKDINVNVSYRSKSNTADLDNTVDTSKYEWIMKLAFRGFENALKHWISGFNCWFYGNTPRHTDECSKFRKKLLAKRSRNKL